MGTVPRGANEEYTSTSDSSDGGGLTTLNYSYLMLDTDTLFYNLEQYASTEKKSIDYVENLILSHNSLSSVPPNIPKFSNLRSLDISCNNISHLPESITECQLTSLNLKNNNLANDSFPKSFGSLTTLKELNLSGNNLSCFPLQVLELTGLKYLYLGSNKIADFSKDIWRLQFLQILYMGGNQLTDVPASVGQLRNLQILVLSDNELESLPAAIANLKNLRTLRLHKNNIRVLPPEIVGLKSLTELSLRDNPLVVRFVSSISLNPPTLLEHAARVVKCNNIFYGPGDIPNHLIEYLDSAHHCVNPRCKGVFFDNRVEHVKFVDFCGKYRIPLLQYLCSSRCISESSSESSEDEAAAGSLMRKVLLG